MTNKEIALAVFVTEQEAGLHEGLTFEQWYASKTNEVAQEVTPEQTEAEMMKEWEMSGDTTIIIENKKEESEEIVNDLTLLNGLGKEFTVGAVMRLQHFIRNKKLGKVISYKLTKGNNGDIVGTINGTHGSVMLRQHVYYSRAGKECLRMRVTQY